MSQQNIYTIQLLNDLHNHFPEILYNPGRFEILQDLLDYIIEVANNSPYTRGRQQYYARRVVNTRVNNIRAAPPQPSLQPTAAGPGPSYTIPVNNSTIPQAFVTSYTFEENQPARVRMSYNNNNNALMSTLLGGLFGDMLGGQNLNTFLNERVPVYPSNQEIANATILIRTNRRQEDLCAICQDEIGPNQDMRRINHCNHYFHQDCIDTWFRGNVHCPTCRHDIREVEVNRSNQNGGSESPRQNNPPPVPENHRRTNIRDSDDN